MRFLYSHVFFLAIIHCAMAQSKIDTLKDGLNASAKTGDKEYVANYQAQIGFEFLVQGKYDSAISYLLKSVNTSIVNAELAGSNYNSLGIAYNNKGFPDSALYYYDKALAVYSQLNDTTRA